MGCVKTKIGGDNTIISYLANERYFSFTNPIWGEDEKNILKNYRSSCCKQRKSEFGLLKPFRLFRFCEWNSV